MKLKLKEGRVILLEATQLISVRIMILENKLNTFYLLLGIEFFGVNH